MYTAGFTLPSMTATQELVVPRSIPMMSAPPAAWLAALALQIDSETSGAIWALVGTTCMSYAGANLKALKSKGPVLRGRDASDNCNQSQHRQHLQLQWLRPLAPISNACLLGKQLHRRLAWPVQTPGPVQPLFLN